VILNYRNKSKSNRHNRNEKDVNILTSCGIYSTVLAQGRGANGATKENTNRDFSDMV
jgi:hypothetical protein